MRAQVWYYWRKWNRKIHFAEKNCQRYARYCTFCSVEYMCVHLGSIPGVPSHYKIAFIQQELPIIKSADGKIPTVYQYVTRSMNRISSVKEELQVLNIQIQELEEELDAAKEEQEITALAEELCVLEDRRDSLTKELGDLQQEDKKKGMSNTDSVTKEEFDALVRICDV